MVGKFLNYLLFERNYSEKTVEVYGKDLLKFESYFKSLDGQLSWTSVDSDVVRGWMESMMDKGNNATSVNRRLSALRSFFRFALSSGWVERDPAYGVTGPKKSKPLPKFIREDDMERMLDERMWGSTYKDVLARTIIQLFYETGIRSAELVGLDDGMVDLENMHLKVTGKRNKQRIVPFGEGMRDMLEEYIAKRDEEVARVTGGFFLSEKGRRFTTDSVRAMVTRQLGRVTMQKKRSPHVLRHSFATAMLNHEAGIESVKKLLGHKSLSTTEVYTHTTFEQLKRVYKTAHPRG